MGYLSIPNLYKHKDFLSCYALEKIHGTSAHIEFRNGRILYFSGCADIDEFIALFDQDQLKRYALRNTDAIVYGEAFGGNCHNMQPTYGDKLRFAAFDVLRKPLDGEPMWLDVPSAARFVKNLGIDFVPWRGGPLSIDWLDAQRDMPSEVAIHPNAQREGIVIRPIREQTKPNGVRLIFKHKADSFRETGTPRRLKEAVKVLSDPQAIADEWVTPMRLQHVTSKMDGCQNKPVIALAVLADVKKESEGEIEWSQAAEEAIKTKVLELIDNE